MIGKDGKIQKTRVWLIALGVAMLSLSLAACGSSGSRADVPAGSDFPKNPDGYADISVEQLASLMEGEEITLVNVHVPYEGEIRQTDLFIPFDDIADHLSELPDKEATIVLYCRSGSMSTSAAQELAALGYTNILEVDGGFSAWLAAGNELLRK
jgi:rhodanese-related sulfurtransferase